MTLKNFKFSLHILIGNLANSWRSSISRPLTAVRAYTLRIVVKRVEALRSTTELCAYQHAAVWYWGSYILISHIKANSKHAISSFSKIGTHIWVCWFDTQDRHKNSVTEIGSIAVYKHWRIPLHFSGNNFTFSKSEGVNFGTFTSSCLFSVNTFCV